MIARSSIVSASSATPSPMATFKPVGEVVGAGSANEPSEVVDGMVWDGQAGEHHRGDVPSKPTTPTWSESGSPADFVVRFELPPERGRLGGQTSRFEHGLDP